MAFWDHRPAAGNIFFSCTASDEWMGFKKPQHGLKMHVTQNKILPQKDTIKKGFTRDPVVASALSELGYYTGVILSLFT